MKYPVSHVKQPLKPPAKYLKTCHPLRNLSFLGHPPGYQGVTLILYLPPHGGTQSLIRTQNPKSRPNVTPPFRKRSYFKCKQKFSFLINLKSPTVYSYKELEARKNGQDFKMYDAVPSSAATPMAVDDSSDMDHFLPMLNDYLSSTSHMPISIYRPLNNPSSRCLKRYTDPSKIVFSFFAIKK